MEPDIRQRWLVGSPGYSEDPDVFPLLPGQMLLTGKTPIWSTEVATSVSGRERRRSNWSYPRWRIKIKYEVLRDRPALPELSRLWSFFSLHLGMRTSFYYFDPYDCTVANETIGTGDGSRVRFQLTRTMGSGGVSFTEPVRRAIVPTIMRSGVVASSGWSIDDQGGVVFDQPPPAGEIISWSGQFMFRCRFNSDELEAEQMTRDLWSQSGIELLTVKL